MHADTAYYPHSDDPKIALLLRTVFSKRPKGAPRLLPTAYNFPTAARMMGLSEAELRRWVRAGYVLIVRGLHGKHMVPVSEIRAKGLPC